MKTTRFARCAGVVVMLISTVLLSAPASSAAPASDTGCPDVEVIFARGTAEPPGVGEVGQAFVDALRSDLRGKSLAVYPVDYAASGDFGAGIQFASTVVEGIRDEATHIEATAENCPKTRMVLGGFSQGAAVTGFVTVSSIPKEIPEAFVGFLPRPMPPEVADHVAAVALFGTPSDAWLTPSGAPPIKVGPLYEAKTIELCETGDTICDGAPFGPPSAAHAAYTDNGMAGQAARFAMKRL